MDLGWTSVKDYGATGNGSTDDTSAISAAIAALPNPGVLYFPPGKYKTSGGFTISTPCVVLGAGGGGGNTLSYQGGGGEVGHISQITCTSQTAVLFTVSASGVQFVDLSLVNTYGGTPSAGAAIQTVAGGGDHIQYLGLTIQGFYNNLDHQYGLEWMIDRCYIYDPVNDGLRSQNLDAADEGEMTMSNCQFRQQTYAGGNAIEILQSGGHRISNCLFFGNVTCFQTMIKVNLGTATSDLFISNCEFENFVAGIYITGTPSPSLFNIIINGCELLDGGHSAGQAIFINHGSKIVVSNNLLIGHGQSDAAVVIQNSSHAVLVGNYWESFGSFSGGTGSSDINATANYS